MNLTEISNIIGKSAPLLAGVIGSPLAGLATTALTLVANSFSANPEDENDIINKIKADPDYQLKLRKLEVSHEEFLLTSQNSLLALEAQDKNSAREMQEKSIEKTGHESYMIPFLAVMIFIGLAGGIYCIINYNTVVGETIAFIMGTLREEIKSIYAFYFGISKNKDDSVAS